MNQLSHYYRFKVGLFCSLPFLAIFATSCAKYPTGPSGQTTKLLIVSMTVSGQLNPNDVYIVAFRPSTLLNPIDSGPIPVIAPPWGNGFVAGNCTYFVRWNPNFTPQYTIYQFTDALLNNFVSTGVPVNTTNPPVNGSQINFSVDLSQLAGSVAQALTYQSIQMNFLTMDRIPTGNSGTKNWDALGDARSLSGINTWITIPLTTTGTYNNARYGFLVPNSDVADADPALEISDFSVQVVQQ